MSVLKFRAPKYKAQNSLFRVLCWCFVLCGFTRMKRSSSLLALFLFCLMIFSVVGQPEFISSLVKSEEFRRLTVIVDSIVKSIPEMTWTPGELFFKLREIYRESKLRREQDPPTREGILQEKSILEEQSIWVPYIEGSYLESDEDLRGLTGLEQSDIVFTDWISEPLEPAFYVARVHERKTIVLAIRGTASVADALTDITVAQDSISILGIEGKVHRGFLEAANRFVTSIGSLLEEELQTHPGYSVKVLGHSLGGATATVTAALLKKLGFDVTAFVLAPACAFSLEIAESLTFVTSVIHGDDVVSRFSLRALKKLTQKLNYIEVAISTEAREIFDDAYGKAQEIQKEIGNMLGEIHSNLYHYHVQMEGKREKFHQKIKRKMGRLFSRVFGGETQEKESENPIDELHVQVHQKENLLEKREKDELVEEFGKVEMGESLTLYPAGICYHLYRAPQKTSQDEIEWRYVVKKQPVSYFETIEVTDSMLTDHFCVGYRDGLKEALESLENTENSFDEL